jgi:hypothetical protein
MGAELKNILIDYKYSFVLLVIFLLLSMLMPLFLGAFLIALGALISRVFFDQGRQQLNGKTLIFVASALIFVIATICSVLFFTPALQTDWEVDGPNDALIIFMMGFVAFSVLLLLPLSGYVADRIFRSKKILK